MLESLSRQSKHVGKIIVADGDGDAVDVCREYSTILPVVLLKCETRGQIAQRNYALQFVDENFYVVIYLDDDMILEPDCIERLLVFWNTQGIEPAGVGLNITNMPEQKDSFLRRFFLMRTRPMGKVLVSGYNTPVAGVTLDLDTQWLAGGATAWRRDILQKYRNAPIQTSWAVGEDLMFSYPISKIERLAICSGALCRHVDEAPPVTFDGGRFRAYRGVVSRYVFVRTHLELNQAAFFWMIFGQLLGRLIRVVAGRSSEWGYLVGTADALMHCLASIGRSDVTDMLSDGAK